MDLSEGEWDDVMLYTCATCGGLANPDGTCFDVSCHPFLCGACGQNLRYEGSPCRACTVRTLHRAREVEKCQVCEWALVPADGGCLCKNPKAFRIQRIALHNVETGLTEQLMTKLCWVTRKFDDGTIKSGVFSPSVPQKALKEYLDYKNGDEFKWKKGEGVFEIVNNHKLLNPFRSNKGQNRGSLMPLKSDKFEMIFLDDLNRDKDLQGMWNGVGDSASSEALKQKAYNMLSDYFFCVGELELALFCNDIGHGVIKIGFMFELAITLVIAEWCGFEVTMQVKRDALKGALKEIAGNSGNVDAFYNKECDIYEEQCDILRALICKELSCTAVTANRRAFLMRVVPREKWTRMTWESPKEFLMHLVADPLLAEEDEVNGEGKRVAKRKSGGQRGKKQKPLTRAVLSDMARLRQTMDEVCTILGELPTETRRDCMESLRHNLEAKARGDPKVDRLLDVLLQKDRNELADLAYRYYWVGEGSVPSPGAVVAIVFGERGLSATTTVTQRDKIYGFTVVANINGTIKSLPSPYAVRGPYGLDRMIERGPPSVCVVWMGHAPVQIYGEEVGAQGDALVATIIQGKVIGRVVSSEKFAVEQQRGGVKIGFVTRRTDCAMVEGVVILGTPDYGREELDCRLMELNTDVSSISDEVEKLARRVNDIDLDAKDAGEGQNEMRHQLDVVGNEISALYRALANLETESVQETNLLRMRLEQLESAVKQKNAVLVTRTIKCGDVTSKGAMSVFGEAFEYGQEARVSSHPPPPPPKSGEVRNEVVEAGNINVTGAFSFFGQAFRFN